MDGNVSLGSKFKKTSKIKEKAREAVTEYSDGEFRLKFAKHMKEMESTQKELVELLKAQNALLQAQIDTLRNELHQLSEKQTNQTKTIIKYNKENARQLAINERETLEYVMMELKKAIEDNAGAVAANTDSEPAPVVEVPVFAENAPVFEEVSGAELFEVNDLPADEEFVMPDLPDPEEIPDRLEVPVAEEPSLGELMEEEPSLEALVAEEPSLEELLAAETSDSNDDFDLSALFADLAEGAMEEEMPAEPAPVVEEKAEEPAPANDPLAGFGSDPNAMMTPEDIAKLLEAMGQ